MEELRPNSQRAKNAIILIWIIFGFEVIGLISGYFQYELLQAIDAGENVTEEMVTLNDLRERLIGILNMIAYIISAVMFIRWFRRAYFNLHVKVSPLSFSEDWASTSWFIPFINWFRPYHIMKELYVETKELLEKNARPESEQLSTSWLWVWWTLWLINNFVEQAVFRHSLHAKTVDDLIVTTQASMISSIIGIPLAVVAIKIIRDYANVESLLSEVKGDKEWPQPDSDNEEVTR